MSLNQESLILWPLNWELLLNQMMLNSMILDEETKCHYIDEDDYKYGPRVKNQVLK